LPTAGLPVGTRFEFTWVGVGSGVWAGQNYAVEVVAD